ncbi:MAG: DUF4389 domain-containing protein [Magnetococcales bacterium]|nr:DUF4389 domain-containing protein [Magnetococcales bacterium]
MMEAVWSRVGHRMARGLWGRLGSMLILVICYGMAETLVLLVVGWQVVTLLTGCTPYDLRVRSFGGQLSRYIYHIFLYLTNNSDRRPFPFSPWLRQPVSPA